MAAARFPVEASHVMMFARSVGDPNPIYYDAEYAAAAEPGTIIAPPTFAQSSAQFTDGYPLRPEIGKPWFGSGREPTGLKPTGDSDDSTANMAKGLHAEQHFEYRRSLKVGDVLTMNQRPGRTWEKTNRNGNTLKFQEQIIEYSDESGEPVVIVTSVGVHTGG
jgi:N-terminal half of MaoC dehydratase